MKHVLTLAALAMLAGFGANAALAADTCCAPQAACCTQATACCTK